MSKSKIKAETDQFIKLLENKKLKEAIAYISKIDVEEPDPNVIYIIGTGLERCLVKKESTPQAMIYALLFYKELFLRSLFDLMESEEQFNPKIHKFIYDNCLYNPTAPPDERGDNYFKDTMKIALNDDVKAMGNTLILLSLELMQCMAKWYPKDYFDDGETRYATYYNELKKRKVSFPTEYTYMKPENEAKFKQNHLKWIKRMQQFQKQIQEQQNKQKEREKKPVEEALKKQHLPQKKTVVEENPIKTNPKPQGKQQLEKVSLSQSKYEEVSQIAPGKQLPKDNKEKPSSQSIVSNPKKEEPEKKEQKPQSSRNIENVIKSVTQIKQVEKDSEAMFILQQKPPQQQPKKGNQQIQPQPQTQPQSQPQPQPQPKPQIQPQPQQKILPQQPNKNKINQKAEVPKPELGQKQEKIKPIETNNLPSKRPSANFIPPNPAEKKSERSLKQEQSNSAEKKEVEQKSPDKSDRIEDKSHREGPRIRLPKTQKPNKSMNTEKKQENFRNLPQNENTEEIKKFYRTEKKFLKDEISNAKKSLPKVEKKNLVSDEFYGVEYINSSPTPNKYKSQFKTLSDFRNLKNKRKIGNNQQVNFAPAEPILRIIERSGLGEKTIPFLPEYFEPVNMRMEALIFQSLRIGSSSTLQPSKAFYKKSKIALRLIKSQGSYLLSIVNLSTQPMNIGYSPGLQAKYGDENGCRIKVKGLERARLEDVSAWRVQPSQFADIPFDFETTDPNFKFLQIVLAIDNQIINFLLPITLLDQGVITNALDLAEIDSFIDMHGRILKSTPIKISLGHKHRQQISLPPFFGRNQNRDSKLLGFMTYSIKLNANKEINVSILVKQCQYSAEEQQIHAIYDNRIGENEDFAKVLIQLMCFLLAKEP